MTASLASREIYRFAGAVLAGCISATIFSVALDHAESLVFFVIYATAVPLFIAGLGAGSLAGIVASAVGFVNLIIREPSNYAVLYAFIYALPAVALTILALRHRTSEDGKTYWYPEGHLLTAIALYPCILFALMGAIASGHEGGLLALTHDFFTASAAELEKGMTPDAAAQVTSLFDVMARYMPAAVSLSWMLLTVISMIVGQGALQQHRWNRRSAFTLRDLHAPGWLINAVAITGLAGVLTNDPYAYVGANLAIMLGVPFLFVGLAIIHAWARTKNSSWLILTAFYLMLIVMPFLALLVTLLGVTDQWANFRQRFAKQTTIT